MSCCGNRATKSGVPASSLPSSQATQPARATVLFEYVGATRLFAEGPATRRRYVFQHPGAVLEVDARDAPSLARIPLVRRRRRESG